MRGDICAPCCGTEREQTVSCPLDCEYLSEARKHEVKPYLNPDTFPNRDIVVDEKFLMAHEPVLLWLSMSVLRPALATEGLVDGDVREGLESLIKTYRTLQSGLVYESRPANPLAGAVYEAVQVGVEEFRKRAREKLGAESLRDVEVLGVLVFLQRLELQHNNGRRRGRAFIDFLRSQFPEPTAAESSSRLIQP